MKGAAVVMLELAGPLAKSLSESFHVVNCASAGSAKAVAAAIAQAQESSGADGYSLIAPSHAAAEAVSHANEAGSALQALVLLAPSSDRGVDGRALALEQVRAPTLVLCGTRDQTNSAEIARQYARRIPKCFFTVVYDAGADLQADRPGALYSVVSDFLARGEKFLVPDASTAINP